jgi:hypothetical protein
MKQKSLSQMNKEKKINKEQEYQSGGAYRAFLKLFRNNLKEENDNNKQRSKRV